MNSKKVNMLFDDLRNGLINEKEALSCIYEFICSNKAFFNIRKLDEDDINDFIIYIYESLKKSFINFNCEKSSYVTYLQNIVRLNYKSWIRISSRSKSIQRYIITQVKNEYNEDDDTYHYFSDITEEYNSSGTELQKFDTVQLLAVALKSSYFLTPSHISTLAKKTGLTEEYIWSLKRNVDDFMKDKYKKNEDRIERIHKSYFFRQRALETLSYLPKNHPYYPKVYRTFIFHDENWKKKRQNIQYRTVLPVNSYIAKLLNISESVVIRAVAKAKKILIRSGNKV